MDSQNLTKRVTLFSGHYGSGKTNIAVNYAMALKKQGLNISVYDMDIVNPYYRTLDAKPMLDALNIPLIASGYANTNVDLPAVSPQAYSITADKSKNAVVDIGGDDRGALVLGRYVDDILQENNYEFIYVLNKFRLETSTTNGAIEVMREIEETAKMKFTSIVSNGNLAEETTKTDVMNGLEFSSLVAEMTNLKVLFTCVSEELFNKEKFEIKNILPIKLIKYLSFK